MIGPRLAVRYVYSYKPEDLIIGRTLGSCMDVHMHLHHCLRIPYDHSTVLKFQYV